MPVNVLYLHVDKVVNLCLNNNHPHPNTNSQYSKNCIPYSSLSNSKEVVKSIVKFTHDEH